jgi:hypothetical protein
MITLKNILFQLFLFAFMAFFLAHDIVLYCHYENCKIENTNSDSGSRAFCTSETSLEEDIPFFAHYYTSQLLNYSGNDLLSPVLFYRQGFIILSGFRLIILKINRY